MVLDSRAVSHPAYPDAVVRAPGLVALDASREDVYTQECFGPVTFLIGTASTDQSLAQFRDTVREHGAMTAAVYSTSEEVLDAAREAAADAGVALSREPHRPGVRQPDRGVLRLPRHRRQPGGQRGLHRRGVRGQPLPGGHQPPPRLRRLSPGTSAPRRGARQIRAGRGAFCHDDAMRTIAIKIAVNGVALWVAALVIPGIHLGEDADQLGTSLLTIVLVALLFGVINTFVKPIVMLFSLPFIILTLGLFTFVVNALMLELTSGLSRAIGLDFDVEHFFWDSVLGAIVITLVSMILNLILPDKD